MDNMYLRELTELYFKENKDIFLKNEYTRTVVGYKGKGKNRVPIYKVTCPQYYKCSIGQALYKFYQSMHKIDKLMDKFKIPFIKEIKYHSIFKTPHLNYYTENKDGELCRVFSVVIMDNNFNIKEYINSLPRYKDGTIIDEKYFTEGQKEILNMVKDYSFINSIEVTIMSTISRVLDYQTSEYTSEYIFTDDEFEEELYRLWEKLFDENCKLKVNTLNRILKLLLPN